MDALFNSFCIGIVEEVGRSVGGWGGSLHFLPQIEFIIADLMENTHTGQNPMIPACTFAFDAAEQVKILFYLKLLAIWKYLRR